MPDLKTIWIALRPFSLPASGVPVALGTALAVSSGQAAFNLPHFLLALFGMMLLHSAANVFNDVSDYREGLDTQVFPVSGAVVRGLLTQKQALLLSATLALIGVAAGLYLSFKISVAIFSIGVAGFLNGIFYSTGRRSLKFYALGDLAVFFGFGILGSVGGWTVQTGHVSIIPALWAVPFSLFVIAILHANNWRDIQSDSRKSCNTVARLLGPDGSFHYYLFLIFMPYVLEVILSFIRIGELPLLPKTFWLTFFTLPLAFRISKIAFNQKHGIKDEKFPALDGETARLALTFGALQVFAAIIHNGL